jgi:hypothetical protein
MMKDTYGRMLGTPLAQYDPEERCWKTSEVTSLWALPMSSPTLPPWGYLHDGALFEQPTPVRLTTGHGFSSLPTPTADEASNATRSSGSFQSLTRSVVTLPTPRAQNGEPRNQTIYKREGPQNLENALALLPTPVVNDMGAGKTHEWWDYWTAKIGGHGKSLEQEALRVGVTTPPPLNAGNTSSDDQHQPQLFTETTATG